MEQFDKYIWKVVEGDEGPETPGWYFQDEAEQLNGPFSSRQEVLDALDAYVKEML